MKLSQKILTKIVFTFSLFLFILTGAQEQIFIGEKHKVFSKILNEEREIWIHLPKSYKSSEIKPANYPVIYLLDAEFNFEYYAPMTDYFSKSPYALFPEFIVVSIKNTDRTRDLTPTKASKKSPVNGKMLFENSGGGENFLNFIQQELKPFISSKFRTVDYSVFVGHSFGGLAVINAMLSHPEYFNSYVAIDPSLWWDSEVMIAKTKDYLSKHQQKFPSNISLYLAQADNEEQNKVWNNDMVVVIQKFDALVKQNGTLHYGYKFYTGEDHGTLSYPANYEALKFIFDGFKTDVKQIVKQPELLEKFYSEFSQKSDYEWKPSETYLNFIIKFSKENGYAESEKYFTEMKHNLYP